VGFSLDDDNFHRIVDAVRRAVTGATQECMGSVVALFPNPLVEQLWGDDLAWIHLADDAEEGHAVAARRFELFLDCLSFHATAPRHLLNPRFAAVLTPAERELREALAPARAWMHAHRPDPDAPVAAAWSMLGDLLRELGDPDEVPVRKEDRSGRGARR
jgi:hypothetical protein